MTTIRTRGKLALVAVLAASAIGSAAPAQADVQTARLDCDAGLERLEARFREVEERRGWEAATKWWDRHWKAYYERCLAP